MKTRQIVPKISPETQALLKKNNRGIRLDIGCGSDKLEGHVGIDILPLPGVDIVHNLEQFPWPLPDECCSTAQSMHLVEHITPTAPDPRLSELCDLLIRRKVLTQKDVDKYLGETRPGPIFLRFMDEVWRILKVGGLFHFITPMAGSPGYWWDPTHINPIHNITPEYFDPLGQQSWHPVLKRSFWWFYKPKPWKIEPGTPIWTQEGNIEIILRKRAFREDGNYAE